MKKILLLTLFFVTVSMTSQNSISEYEYVVVASKFGFLKKADQYKTSSLTAFLFNKIGLKAYVDSETLPALINQDRCQFLFVDVLNDSGFFVTKNSIVFKDCTGRIVYTSMQGTSKKKEYGKAYHEAIRNAFKDPVIQDYEFTPKIKTGRSSVSEVVAADTEVVQSETVTNVKVKEVVSTTVNKASDMLYAQAISNGFQLINTEPKMVFTILKTSNPKLYIIQNGKGILYAKGDVWLAEYYEGDTRIVKELHIKF